MRKAFALLLLLALSAGGIGIASAVLAGARDQVTFDETTLYGDPRAADGLTVSLGTTYEHHLFWDTTYAAGSAPRAETEYRFSSYSQPEHRTHEPSGISMDNTLAYGADFQTDERQPGIAQAYRELYDATAPGDENEKTIFLRDYCDYYPIAAAIDLPGTNLAWSSDYFADLEPVELVSGKSDHYAITRFREFFKIPVLEEESIHISISRGTGDSVSIGSSSTGSDRFHLNSESAITADACFFAFDAHTYKGNLVDTSLIPGGFGIYRVPYHEFVYDDNGKELFNVIGADMDGLEMVYALDPNIRLVSLDVNSDGSRLLLHTVENGRYIITVIDAATLSALQRVDVAASPADADSWLIYDGGDFLAVVLYASRELSLLAVNGDGEYEPRFTVPLLNGAIPEDSGKHLRYLSSGAVMDYDGERLAVSSLYEFGWGESCDFFLAVYDGSGLLYYGAFDSSLSANHLLYDYSSCEALDVDPLWICWQ